MNSVPCYFIWLACADCRTPQVSACQLATLPVCPVCLHTYAPKVDSLVTSNMACYNHGALHAGMQLLLHCGCSHRGHAGDKSARHGAPARLPNWQMVPGTNFVVDKFGGKAYEAAPTSKHWFLTHFHADHYGGLGPRFKQGML